MRDAGEVGSDRCSEGATVGLPYAGPGFLTLKLKLTVAALPPGLIISGSRTLEALFGRKVPAPVVLHAGSCPEQNLNVVTKNMRT